MTTTEGVVKRLALLIALITTLSPHPRRTPRSSRSPSRPACPRRIAQGGSFTVTVPVKKATKKTKVALTLSKDAKADKKDVKLATLKLKGKKFSGKVTVTRRARPLPAAGVRRQGVRRQADQGHRQGRPPPARAGARTPERRPDLPPGTGNEQLPPPAPTVTPTTRHRADADADAGPRSRRTPRTPRRSSTPAPRPRSTTRPSSSTPAPTRSSATSSRARSAPSRSRSCAAPCRTATASRSRACRVTVLDHDELGMTNTRADGKFDLAVNGGGVTLAVRASPAS